MKTAIPLLRTRNDLPEEARLAAVALLQTVLFDLIDLGLQLKQAHWNVKGPNFVALHELFENLAEDINQIADEVAERAVALGGVAAGTVQSVAVGSRLPAFPLEPLSGEHCLRQLADAVSLAGAQSRSAIEPAAAAGDADTADALTQASRILDRMLWMLEAHQ